MEFNSPRKGLIAGCTVEGSDYSNPCTLISVVLCWEV